MYVCMYVCMYIYIYIYIGPLLPREAPGAERELLLGGGLRQDREVLGKTTNGVGTNGVTASFLTGICWVPICQNLTKLVNLCTLFPNLSKSVTFAATPLVSTPFVRNPIRCEVPTPSVLGGQSTTIFKPHILRHHIGELPRYFENPEFAAERVWNCSKAAPR